MLHCVYLTKSNGMNLKRNKSLSTFLSAIIFLFIICETHAQVLDHNKLAKEYYHEDA